MNVTRWEFIGKVVEVLGHEIDDEDGVTIWHVIRGEWMNAFPLLKDAPVYALRKNLRPITPPTRDLSALRRETAPAD